LNANATFVHFIVTQMIGLFMAVVGGVWSLEKGCFAFLGFLVFVYGLTLGVAAALNILWMSKWRDQWIAVKNRMEVEK
jgi:hypothetical protein